MAANIYFDTTVRWGTASEQGYYDRLNQSSIADVYTWDMLESISGNPNLGRRAKQAFAKLERLLYVFCGAIPDYETQTPWWECNDPRCQWPQQLRHQPTETSMNPDVYIEEWLETAACGATAGGGHSGAVPIRSRSGDPAMQFRQAQHSEFFPEGAVERYCESPENTGHQVHDPASSEDDNFGWHDRETVTIRWTKPGSVTSVEEGPTLCTTRATFPMVEISPGVYEATIDSAAQDTWVDWYIKAKINGVDQWRHDPFVGFEADNVTEKTPVLSGRVEDPEHVGPNTNQRKSDAAYSFVFYTHYNPYAGGLPELWDKCRKGTDYYTFAGGEEIQPGLINLARWCLQYIGKRVQHHPRRRGSQWELCCLDLPITFRWSGSNRPGHYRSGGKDGTRPLTDHPEETLSGSEAARMTWRGQDMLWKEMEDWGSLGLTPNCYFGGNESWTHAPEVVKLEVCDYVSPFPANYDDGAGTGLQHGDVIDPVHMEEIIDAVDHLIDNGLWVTVGTYSVKWSPGTVAGIPCGLNYSEQTGYHHIFCSPSHSYIDSDWLCCPTPESCPDVTWEECYGSHGLCLIEHGEAEHAVFKKWTYPSSGSTTGWCHMTTLNCRNGSGENSHVWASDLHVYRYPRPDEDPPDERYSVGSEAWRTAHSVGWSGRLCGPKPYRSAPGEGTHATGEDRYNRVDTAHGNGWIKIRKEWVNGQFLTVDSTLSWGNSFEGTRAVSCGSHPADPEPHPHLDYYEVKTVLWRGLGVEWLNQVGTGPGAIGNLNGTCGWFSTWGIPSTSSGYPRLLTGMGSYIWPHSSGEEYRLCVWDDDHDDGQTQPYPSGYPRENQCSAGGACRVGDPYPNCKGDMMYAEIDLYLDGQGYPTLKDHDLGVCGVDINGQPEGTYPRDHCLRQS